MKNLKARGKSVISPVLATYFDDFEVAGGKGHYLVGLDGKKYLDFAAGIACCPVGHCHPRVVAAIKRQSEKLLHTCIGIAYYAPYIELAEELQKIAPMKDAKVFLCQSGSEANEAAIKLAKYVTKKPGIVAFQGGFHGRTLGALSVTTSKMKYREGYEPLLPEVYIAPLDLAVLEGLINAHAGRIGAMILEPILGEGGYVVVPKEFQLKVRQLCDKNNILLIYDEVQTGVGRTGKWFACEHVGVIPDIMTVAKGIASGLPLGVCMAKGEVMDKWSPGAHGSTFGGNPVCCASALATLKVIREGNLLANAAKLGNYLKSCLQKLQKEFPAILEVRGMGLMIGVETGDAEMVKKIINFCLEKGLVLISTGGNGTAIRFIPPLDIRQKEIDQALKLFRAALENV
jgi:predicted acetylornithine/succinylornithine family transaminase